MQTKLNPLKAYKHRYKNINIRNLDKETGTDIIIKVFDYDFRVSTTIGEKLIIFKDDKDCIYHVSVCNDALEMYTEIFVNDDKKNPRILVIENDTGDAMIVSPDEVKHHTVYPIKDKDGDIITYLIKDTYEETEDSIRSYNPMYALTLNGIVYRDDNNIEVVYNKNTSDYTVLYK